ncbi:hypothetical protein GV794_00760 [Nocardia cyriacigeorgica]|uniref:Uncharacterized protein n=1 Tax=Nocardia cyriacigeorgica TaxID=135487 RepID=A0A6P1DGD9_9NOCA|nr:hypothetical protein [Nocardia cyriacigeorgica]NEW38365.1 hypothetical protein [Nocardia cyriacigeorgica]NEW47633.1 hypothetical protein [Nocardia cyriacigeorgica]NEW49308.1 hypothetical protein [Nocardia cyriacigeorgica]NEW54203.1 hypothetical protein [Nocardia cyriacigeorgica]
MTDFEVPNNWTDARPLLRPVLRPVTYRSTVPAADQPLGRTVFPFVDELVAIDLPDRRVLVQGDHRAAWGVSDAEVFAASQANLAEMVQPPDVDDESILRFVDDGDSYFASWILVPGWLDSFRAGYGRRAVAFLPDADTLLVAPDDPELIGDLFEMIEEQYGESERPLSPQAYTVDDDGQVVPFDQAGAHEQLPAAHRARCGLAVTEYAAQSEWLNEILDIDLDFESLDADLADPSTAFVATLMYYDSDDGPRTITAWGEGVDYLLPEADLVVFCDTDDDGNERTLFDAPFARVVEILGLTPVPGLAPPRYEIRSWPEPEVLARIEQAAVTG